MQNNIRKLNPAELPAFPGPSKNGGKIFKANPNIVNAHQTRVVRSNTIGLIFFSVRIHSKLRAYLCGKIFGQ